MYVYSEQRFHDCRPLRSWRFQPYSDVDFKTVTHIFFRDHNIPRVEHLHFGLVIYCLRKGTETKNGRYTTNGRMRFNFVITLQTKPFRYYCFWRTSRWNLYCPVLHFCWDHRRALIYIFIGISWALYCRRKLSCYTLQNDVLLLLT